MSTTIKSTKAHRNMIYRRAALDAVIKLDPRRMVHNPVMFVVEVGSGLTTGLWMQSLTGDGEAETWFIGLICV